MTKELIESGVVYEVDDENLQLPANNGQHIVGAPWSIRQAAGVQAKREGKPLEEQQAAASRASKTHAANIQKAKGGGGNRFSLSKLLRGG